jgi:FtsH-binding integral membrane protein
VLPLTGDSAYPQKSGGRTERRSGEANVASGFILLLLIGILIGFVVSRFRKRMGLGVTWSTWVTTVVVVGFILLLMWVTAYKR